VDKNNEKPMLPTVRVKSEVPILAGNKKEDSCADANDILEIRVNSSDPAALWPFGLHDILEIRVNSSDPAALWPFGLQMD
jgi:hypothetical protein